jgi:diguanylate cyclase (GGDEF)-like protein
VADGVTIRSYWVHAGVRLADGTLLFGGLKGLTVAHPERLADWTFAPPVVAAAIRVGGRTVPPGPLVVVNPEDRNLQVEFAALDYSAPEANTYAYRLLGYDADWTQTDAQHRIAVYTNLQPGDYTLLLRGTNHAGLWTDPPTRLPIRVLPAWYQTLWARGLALIALVGCMYGIVRFRTLRLVRNREALEREVARRTGELKESQHALERSNLTLAASVETLRTLGEIGRGITASLEVADIYTSLCSNIGTLLDADSVSIWLLDAPTAQLRLAFGLEDGQPLPPLTVALDDPERGVARAARERREFLIEYPPEQRRAIGATSPMATALFGPLLVEEHLFGVISVQSRTPHAYGDRERLAFASLCAYGATALANAEAHRDLARANAELGRIAAKDPLTGLANRREFFRIAAEEVARAHRYQRALSVIVVDLDQFKRINDTRGHAAGDMALQTAAFCFAHSLRETDLAARFGGEEFIALLPETGIEGAAQVAERFRDLLAGTDISHNGSIFRVTASIGVSAWHVGEDGIERAIERADAALYRVKRGGRNAVAVEDQAGG